MKIFLIVKLYMLKIEQTKINLSIYQITIVIIIQMEIENQQIVIRNRQAFKQTDQKDQTNQLDYRTCFLSQKLKAFILLQLSQRLALKNSDFQFDTNQSFQRIKKMQSLSKWRLFSRQKSILKKQISNIICKQRLSPYTFLYRLKQLISQSQEKQKNNEQLIKCKQNTMDVGNQICQILTQGIIVEELKSKQLQNPDQKQANNSNQTNAKAESRHLFQNKNQQKQKKVINECLQMQNHTQNQRQNTNCNDYFSKLAQGQKEQDKLISEINLEPLQFKSNTELIKKLKQQMQRQFKTVQRIGLKIDQVQKYIDLKTRADYPQTVSVKNQI